MSWTNPRSYNEVVKSIATGVVAETWIIHDSAELVSLQFNFSDTPDSENCVVRLLNSDGYKVRSYTFNPANEGTNEITKVFENWRLPKGGGSVNVGYANTSNHVSEVIASWEYNDR